MAFQRSGGNRFLSVAQYEATLAARRYEAVDPTKRLVARELEKRWNAALERVAQLEERLTDMVTGAANRRRRSTGRP